MALDATLRPLMFSLEFLLLEQKQACDNGDDPAGITLAEGESVTCTFANIKQDTITVVKQTIGGDGAFDFSSAALGDFTLVTSNGTASQSFANLSPGTYDVAETVPDGWQLAGATGDAVTCTFENLKQYLLHESHTITCK